MGVLHLLFLALSLTTIFTTITTTEAHNITAILSGFPQYSQFNTYLTQTKLSDDINSRDTITVLVLDNAAVSILATKQYPISVIKNALSLHVLLDYFDGAKLHQISSGTALSTTLYQTTGDAQGQVGFVNITLLKGGKVGFGSAAAPPGSALNSTYVQEVKKIPYHISVLEISEAILAPGVLTSPAPSVSDVNITALLEKAGCKAFASLIEKTGVLKVYQAAADTGLTVFAPSDGAFKAQNVPDLSKLTNAEMVSLLQYHALPIYAPKGTLKTTKGPIDTMATNGVGKYDLTVTTAGDEVTLGTGYSSSRIASTVVDSTPLVIFTVDSLLLPTELFGKSSSAAPTTSPSPSPVVPAKAPSPVSAKAPSSVFSPPAPPMESPVGAPAGGPSQSENTNSGNAAGDVKAPTLFKALLVVSVTVIISVFLS